MGNGENKKGPDLAIWPLFFHLVRLAGIEPTTPWFVAKYSIQLSYSRKNIYYMNCSSRLPPATVKLVRLAGIEPTTPWFVAKYSIQLSYSRKTSTIITGSGQTSSHDLPSRSFNTAFTARRSTSIVRQILVRLAGIEPTTPWFVAKYSIQLSYSRNLLQLFRNHLQSSESAFYSISFGLESWIFHPSSRSPLAPPIRPFPCRKLLPPPFAAPCYVCCERSKIIGAPRAIVQSKMQRTNSAPFRPRRRPIPAPFRAPFSGPMRRHWCTMHHLCYQFNTESGQR